MSQKIIILASLSGAGQTTVLNMLEDQGFLVIENLPVFVLEPTINHLTETAKQDKIAICLESYSVAVYQGDWDQLKRTLACYGEVEYWLLTAQMDCLIARYNQTRRPHPLAEPGQSLVEAIEKNIDYLRYFSAKAHVVLDTSQISGYQLQKMVDNAIGTSDTRNPMQIQIMSFGFKYQIPPRVDYIFDVRCLPNPYWEPMLRPYTGLDQPVQSFFQGQEIVQQMIDDIIAFMKKWAMAHSKLRRNYLDIAIGCTGGQHRSVYVAQAVYQELKTYFPSVCIHHQALDA